MGACQGDFFNLHGMVNRGLIIFFIICYWIIYLSKDGSMRTGACILEHADRSVPTKRCDKKGEGHEYGSMQTGAIYFQQKIITYDFINLHGMVRRDLDI